MRIEVSAELKENDIKEKLKHAEIVEDGDYILMPKNKRLSVYGKEGLVFIDVHEIDYVYSDTKEIRVYCEDDNFISTLKLYEYLEYSSRFIRTSKTSIVNIDKIEEIRPSLNMKFKIRIKTTWLEVNRTYYYEFKDAIGI